MHYEQSSKPVPYVPKGEIRNDIMKIYHDTQANDAHFGRDKTIKKIKARYYWNTMNRDIANYVNSCIRCNQNNPIRRKPPGHLKPIEAPEGVWQLLSLDFHGPIASTSRRGNKYIISITDILSKLVIAKPVRDCSADTAPRFLQEVICKYGTPKCVLTDNSTHFTSIMMEHLLQSLCITHLYATPYHPQTTNGQIERFNSTMDAKIAALSNQYRSDWDDKLPFVIFNYNTSYHSATKPIPFELMYGRSPVLPFDGFRTVGRRTFGRRTVARGQLVAGQLRAGSWSQDSWSHGYLVTRTFGRNALSMRNMKFEKNRILLFFLWKIKQAKSDVKRFG